MNRYDVVVIGGGPVGAITARVAAESGVRVLLVERRTTPWGPTPCTGLVSPRTLSIVKGAANCVLREIRCVEIHPPGGRSLLLRADETKAVVIDRSALEEELLCQAKAAGAELLRGTEATAIHGAAVLLTAPAESMRVTAKVIIGADGPRSFVARETGLPSPRHLLAVQAVLEAPSASDDQVDVFVGRDVAPGFFAWAVPAERNRLRVGLAVPADVSPQPFLDRLIATRFPRARVLSQIPGWIPSGPAGSTVKDATLLVGDAAGQVKPLSGGGLYTGAICASIAGRVAAEAALCGRTDRESLQEYVTSWQAAMGSEISFGLTVRGAMEALSDEGLNAVCASLDDPGLLQHIASAGDIDHPSRLISELLSRRHLWKHLLGALASFSKHQQRRQSAGTELIASSLQSFL